MLHGRVLVIGGSDSGGGAGIQADLKTIAALGAYGMTAVTALTAQNTLGVHGILPVPADFVRLQMQCVLDDLGADAFKTGMLGGPAIVAAVASMIARTPTIPFVLDPVMVAKGGQALLEADAVTQLKRLLLPLATLLTPNVPEAETLTGLRIRGPADLQQASEALLSLGASAVLLKGGHLEGPEVTDMLATREKTHLLTRPRIATRHTHGTGCTLASAIAARLAQGAPLLDAVRDARDYVQAAIAGAPGFGAGHGPLNHAAPWRREFAQ